MTLLSRNRIRRWTVVALVLVAAAMLAQIAVSETRNTPELGVSLGWRDGTVVVTQVEPAGVAWMDSIAAGDRVVRLNGAPPDAGVSVDGSVPIRSLSAITTSGEQLNTSVPAPASGLVVPSFLITALLFLLVGSGVYIVAADSAAATVVLGLTLASALLFLGPIASLSGAQWANAMTFVALIGFGAGVFMLALVFPIDRLKSRVGRVAAAVCLLTASLVLAVYVASFITGSPYKLARSLALASVALSLLSAAMIVAVGVLRASPDRRGARRAAIQLALGGAGGLIPFCVLSLLPSALGVGYFVRPELSILLVVLIPVALGGALVSREFPGVERLVNRSLVAVVVWVGLFAIYASALRAADDGIAMTRSRSDVTLVVGLAISLATFPILQAKLRLRIERMLFRGLYDPADLVRQIGDDLVRLHDLETVTNHALEQIGEALDLRWAAFWLQGEPATAGPHIWGNAPTVMHPTMSLELTADDEPIGTLALGPKRSDVELQPADYTFLDTVRPLLATAVQNALLVHRLEAQVITLAERERALEALNARFIGVHEEERRSLALDLHDDALQRVVLLTRDLSDERALEPERIAASVARWHESAMDIAIALRAVCRDLRPPMLDDLGLGAALEWLATETRSKSDLEIITNIDDVGRVEPALETSLYRIAQEGLNNVRKHAAATRAVITLTAYDGWLHLELADNGKGFEPGAHTRRHGEGPSLGLLGMRERVAPWNGTLHIAPVVSGGTLISVAVPIPASAEPIAA